MISKLNSKYKKIKTKYHGTYVLPDSWDLEKFGSKIILEYGKGLSEDERTNQGNPVFGSGGKIGEHEQSLVKGPGIIVARKGSLGNVFYTSEDFWAIDTVYYITKEQTSLDLLFLHYYLQYMKLEQYAIVSAHPGISREDVYSILIKIPSKPEQEQIGAVLSSIDELILNIEDQISKTNDLKKGIMQQLFSKGIKNTNFQTVEYYHGEIIKIPKTWEWTTMRDFKTSSGSTPSRKNKKNFVGKIRWVTSGELDYGEIVDTIEKISEEAMKESSLTLYPKDSVMIAITGLEALGTRGRCAFLGAESTVNQSCIVFNNHEKFAPKFLFYFYQNFNEKIISTLAQGTKQQSLSKDLIKFMKVAIPPKPEQEQIVEILTDLDSKIELLNEYKSQLNELKKSVMQKLLTGKVLIKNG